MEELDAALAGPGTEGVEEAVAADELSLRRGSGFAFAVSGVMLSEQTLLNAAVLTVDITSTNVALAGIVFNVLLIARAPLQLFQAIQTSLLPHLTGLEATEGHEAFAKAISVTVMAIAAFALAMALGLLAIGPPVMKALFGQSFEYGRVGLGADRLGHGHASDFWGAQPGGAGAQPGTHRGLLLDRGGGRVRRLDAGAASLAKNCCAPRSAISAPPACWP